MRSNNRRLRISDLACAPPVVGEIDAKCVCVGGWVRVDVARPSERARAKTHKSFPVLTVWEMRAFCIGFYIGAFVSDFTLERHVRELVRH